MLLNKEFTAELNFKCKGLNAHALMGVINIGAITLNANDRIFILDPYYTDFYPNDPAITDIEVRCKLEIDVETFGEENFTLLASDLDAVTGTFYCESDGEEDDFVVEDIILTINIDSKQLEIKLILE